MSTRSALTTPTDLALGRAAERDKRSLSMLANSIALIAGKLATMGLGFLAWLAAARLFDQSAVGLASGIVSAMMLCVQIALFGAGAAIITVYPFHKRDARNLLDTSISFVLLSSLVTSGVFLIVADRFLGELGQVASRPLYAVAFVVMAVTGTLGVLFDQLSTALRRGDQALVRGIVTGVATLGMVATLPLGLGARDALAILGAWAFGNAAPIVVGAFQFRGELAGYHYRPRLIPALTAQIVRVGMPNWLLTLTERAPGTVLPILVTELLSPAANAAWYAAWMMAWVVYIVPIQVGLNLFAEAAHSPSELKRATRQGILTSLGIGVLAAIGAGIVGPYLLQFLGHGYAEAGSTPLRILVLAFIPFTFIQAYFAICRSRGLLREAIIMGLVAGVSGVGAGTLASGPYDLVGMATAWVATQSLVALWAIARLRSLLDRPATEETV